MYRIASNEGIQFLNARSIGAAGVIAKARALDSSSFVIYAITRRSL